MQSLFLFWTVTTELAISRLSHLFSLFLDSRDQSWESKGLKIVFWTSLNISPFENGMKNNLQCMNLRFKVQMLLKDCLVLYTPLDTFHMGILRQDSKKTFGLIQFSSSLPDHKLQDCV